MNTRKVTYDNTDILNAKSELMDALLRVRYAQLKRLTNAGIGYWSDTTRWLRERIAIVECNKKEIETKLQEANNGD